MDKYQGIKFKLCILAVSLFIAATGYAKNSDDWQFALAPYLWAINMNGHERIGPMDAHITENFNDIVKTLNCGAMLQFDARKSNYGMFIDGMYAKTSDKTTLPEGTIKLTTKYGIFTGAAFYTAFTRNYAKRNKLAIEPYLGVRYTLNDATIQNLSTSDSASKNKNWTDPILGTRLRYDINSWQLALLGDVGGTNFNTNKSLNLAGLFGYTPDSAKYLTIYLGYRYLYQKYVTGEGNDLFAWNMRLFGPLLALSFRF